MSFEVTTESKADSSFSESYFTLSTYFRGWMSFGGAFCMTEGNSAMYQGMIREIAGGVKGLSAANVL